MNLSVLATTGKTIAAKVGFQLKRYAPEILTGAGIAAIGVGTVLACKATLEAHEIVDEYKENLNIVQQAHEKEPVRFDEKNVRTAKVEQVIHAGLRFVKLYGPSILVMAGGIAAILGGHDILQKRNAALALAYASLNESFVAYRNRVKNALGDDVDQEFMFDTKTVDIPVKNEDGSEDVLKGVKEVAETEANNKDVYCRWYDCSNSSFSQDPGTNVMVLRQRLTYLQNKEIAQGYLLFNEALKDLGFKQTSIGAVTGWVYDGTEDSLINLGTGFDVLMDPNENDDPEVTKAKRAFMASPGKAIWLNFNVQGPIYQLIDPIIANQ